MSRRPGFPDRNELTGPELLECIRETSLSTVLPPPPDSGEEALMITIPVEPT